MADVGTGFFAWLVDLVEEETWRLSILVATAEGARSLLRVSHKKDRNYL